MRETPLFLFLSIYLYALGSTASELFPVASLNNNKSSILIIQFVSSERVYSPACRARIEACQLVRCCDAIIWSCVRSMTLVASICRRWSRWRSTSRTW